MRVRFLLGAPRYKNRTVADGAVLVACELLHVRASVPAAGMFSSHSLEKKTAEAGSRVLRAYPKTYHIQVFLMYVPSHASCFADVVPQNTATNLRFVLAER